MEHIIVLFILALCFFSFFYLLYSLKEWNRTWNIYKNTIECTKKISKEEDCYEI